MKRKSKSLFKTNKKNRKISKIIGSYSKATYSKIYTVQKKNLQKMVKQNKQFNWKKKINKPNNQIKIRRNKNNHKPKNYNLKNNLMIRNKKTSNPIHRIFQVNKLY